MLSNIRDVWVLACLALVLAAGPVVSQSGFHDTVRIVHTFSTGSSVHERLVETLPELERATDYAVRFEVFSAQNLGGASAVLRGVQDGKYDFLLAGGATFAAADVDVAPLGYYGLFRRAKTWADLRDSHAEFEIERRFQESGLAYIGSVWTSPTYLISSSDVQSIDDLAGKRLGYSGSLHKHQEFLDVIGAASVRVRSFEMLKALEAGVLDGAVAEIDGRFKENPMHLVGTDATVVADPVDAKVAWLVARENWADEIGFYRAESIQSALEGTLIRLGMDALLEERLALRALEAEGVRVTHLGDWEDQRWSEAVQATWSPSPDDRMLLESIVNP